MGGATTRLTARATLSLQSPPISLSATATPLAQAASPTILRITIGIHLLRALILVTVPLKTLTSLPALIFQRARRTVGVLVGMPPTEKTTFFHQTFRAQLTLAPAFGLPIVAMVLQAA